jgi:hypothetical protein
LDRPGRGFLDYTSWRKSGLDPTVTEALREAEKAELESKVRPIAFELAEYLASPEASALPIKTRAIVDHFVADLRADAAGTINRNRLRRIGDFLNSDDAVDRPILYRLSELQGLEMRAESLRNTTGVAPRTAILPDPPEDR